MLCSSNIVCQSQSFDVQDFFDSESVVSAQHTNAEAFYTMCYLEAIEQIENDSVFDVLCQGCMARNVLSTNVADSTAKAKFYQLVAFIYERRGKFREARVLFIEALGIQQELGKHDSANAISWINGGLGNIYVRLGEFSLATELLKTRLDYYLSQEDEVDNQGLSYSDLGCCYESAERYEEAIDCFHRGRKTKGLRDENIGLNEINLAELYLENGAPDSASHYAGLAIGHFQSAIRKGEKEGSRTNNIYRYLGQAYRSASEIKSTLRDQEEALQLIKKSEQTLRLVSAPGIPDRQLGKTLKERASILLNIGLYDEALIAANRGFVALNLDFDSLDKFYLPPRDQITAENTYFELVNVKAEIFAQMAAHQSDQNWDNAALNAYQYYFDNLHHLHAVLLTEFSRNRYAEDVHEISENAIAFCVESYQRYGINDRLWDALYFAEQSKGLGLSASIHRVAASGTFDEASFLLAEIAELESLIRQNQSIHGTPTLPSELATTLEEKKEELALQFPLLYQMRYHIALPSRAALESYLTSSRKQLLSAFYGEEKIYFFFTDGTTIRYQVNNAPDQVRAEIRALQTELMHPDLTRKAKLCHSARWLYTEVLGPLVGEQPVSSLVFIADGPLSMLPLHVLLTEETIPTSDFLHWPFWVKQASFNYPVSLQSFYESAQRKRRKPSKLIMAPTFAGAHYRLPQLFPNTDELAREARRWNGRLLAGEYATADSFGAIADKYSIIQLHTHALANYEEAMKSWIAFSGDTANLLHSSELYRLNLQIDLAILIGCQTGTGEYLPGEGVQSLALAFNHGGSANTVASLWSNNVASGDQFAAAFNFYLRQNGSPGESVQLAQLQLLREGEDQLSRHPAFWSAWINIGPGDTIEVPPFEEDDDSLAWWVCSALVFGTLIWWNFRRRKARKSLPAPVE